MCSQAFPREITKNGNSWVAPLEIFAHQSRRECAFIKKKTTKKNNTGNCDACGLWPMVSQREGDNYVICIFWLFCHIWIVSYCLLIKYTGLYNLLFLSLTHQEALSANSIVTSYFIYIVDKANRDRFISQDMWASLMKIDMKEKELLIRPFGFHSSGKNPSLTYIYKQFYFWRERRRGVNMMIGDMFSIWATFKVDIANIHLITCLALLHSDYRTARRPCKKSLLL